MNSALQVYKGCLCFLQLRVIPLKMIYYPDFIQTWHNWQLYIGRWKTAMKMKSWVHRACFRPACSARNSKCFLPSCARLNVRNFNNRRKFVITWQKLWIIMKSWVRLFVWAIIFSKVTSNQISTRSSGALVCYTAVCSVVRQRSWVRTYGLEGRSAGSFPEKRPFVIPMVGTGRYFINTNRFFSPDLDKESGVTDRAGPCVSLPSDRDVKLIILIIAVTTIITVNIYIINNITSFINIFGVTNIINSIIVIRWWGDLLVLIRVRGRVKRWVQMSCMPCSHEEPCSDQEMRPSLLPWDAC